MIHLYLRWLQQGRRRFRQLYSGSCKLTPHKLPRRISFASDSDILSSFATTATASASTRHDFHAAMSLHFCELSGVGFKRRAKVNIDVIYIPSALSLLHDLDIAKKPLLRRCVSRRAISPLWWRLPASRPPIIRQRHSLRYFMMIFIKKYIINAWRCANIVLP